MFDWTRYLKVFVWMRYHKQLASFFWMSAIALLISASHHFCNSSIPLFFKGMFHGKSAAWLCWVGVWASSKPFNQPLSNIPFKNSNLAQPSVAICFIQGNFAGSFVGQGSWFNKNANIPYRSEVFGPATTALPGFCLWAPWELYFTIWGFTGHVKLSKATWPTLN